MFGIPDLLSGIVKNSGTILLGTVEAGLLNFLSGTPNWGVYQPGTTTKAVTVDSVVSLGWGRDNPVSDYIIETGSFTSYNKVQKSRDVRVELAVGGNTTTRLAFCQWLEQNVNATTLFDILAPEGALQNVTLSSYKIDRTATSGAAKITAACVFKEIRQRPALYYNSGTPSTDTTNAASTTDTPSTPTVLAQPQSLTASVTAYASGAVHSIQNTLAGASAWLP